MKRLFDVDRETEPAVVIGEFESALCVVVTTLRRLLAPREHRLEVARQTELAVFLGLAGSALRTSVATIPRVVVYGPYPS
jgi:hypothetical protein